MSDKISVIVPVYNCEKFIKDCLISIINQTYDNLEIIIIDDGSTDNSYTTIKNIIESDSRIKYFKQENYGQSVARNNGLSYASGAFFIYLDSDDIMDPRTIEILYNQLKNNNSSISVCGYEKFVNIFTEDEYNPVISKTFTGEEYCLEILNLRKDSYAWGTLVDINLREYLYFKPNTYYEDLGSMYKLFVKVNKIVYNPVKLIKYRQHSESIVHKYNCKKVEDYYSNSLEFVQFLNKNYYYDIKLCNSFMCFICISCYNLSYLYNPFQAKEFVKKFQYFKKNYEKKYGNYNFKIKMMIFKFSPKLLFYILRIKNKMRR